MAPKRKSLASLKNHTEPSPSKSIIQPPELSPLERANILAFLNSTEKPFQVATIPATRKRKRESKAIQIQQSDFDERLAVQYEITPGTTWDSLKKYKRFTVQSESITIGECVMVAHEPTERQVIDIHEQWKAQVLDVRALDPEHVYIRVAWLNRPEDLDSGRKSYHGKNELIPTNQIDIIDASSVNGRIGLVHWDENEEDTARLEDDIFFWRQTFDYATTRTFSKLKLICIDQAPQNPERTILQCSNPECRKWMHVQCIADTAVEQATGMKVEAPNKKKRRTAIKAKEAPKQAVPPLQQEKLPDTIDTFKPEDTQKTVGKIKEDGTMSPFRTMAHAIRTLNNVRAEVFIKGMAGPFMDEESGEVAEKTELVMTDIEGRHEQKIQCLFCQHPID